MINKFIRNIILVNLLEGKPLSHTERYELLTYLLKGRDYKKNKPTVVAYFKKNYGVDKKIIRYQLNRFERELKRK